jgi:signal transduction histidine kinase
MNLKILRSVFLITVFVLLFDLIVDNYLLFHILAEFFSIIILFTLFTITWNVKKYLGSGYLLFIGLAGLFIGILDLLHTITFKGMNIIPSPIYYANQFWIATRFFESLVILTGFLFVAKKEIIRVNLLMLIYGLITGAIILSILVFEVFPACYIDGIGQTPFKIYSEYVIINILFIALYFLSRNKTHFEKDIHQLILWSIIFAIVSEFCFTLYIGNYDFINKIGHVFKILSFYMIFKANVQSGFKKPIETFFHDLKISEEKVKVYNLELEKQIATKNRLFSIVAHDLKNPFTILMGYTEYLLDNHDSLKVDERKNIIRTVYETSEETYRLLENLLSWSRAQTNTLSWNPVDFDIMELLDECYLLVSGQANLKKIEFIKDYSSAIVTADRDMSMTIVRNLLSNAVKFTRKEGKVTIRTNKADQFLRISIEDTGVGIPAEKITSLLQLDKNQSTRGTENESGTGLGLILCAEFITLNKGELTIESEIHKGSVFSFTLPLAEKL